MTEVAYFQRNGLIPISLKSQSWSARRIRWKVF